MKIRIPISAGWDKTVAIVSVALTLMGLLVLAGWHAHWRAAIQIFGGLIPMQYNTALCFIALGIGGLGLSYQRSPLLFGGGSFAALMGGTVIVEYATATSFGIDTLFFYPWERSLSADPGRMALTTAVSFLLSGVALLILWMRPGSHGISGIVNTVPLSLALTSLVGYLFRITYVLPFNLGSQMALHTSLAFLAYGIAMLGHAWKCSERGADRSPQWGPGIGVALLPALFIGTSAFAPRQSGWIVAMEALFSVVAVVLTIAAIVKIRTAPVAYKGLLMTVVPLILLLMFVGVVVQVKRQSESAELRALHSTEVISASQSLLTHLAETESASRGYSLTGSDTFIASYEQSLRLANLATTQMSELVSDNPVQKTRAREIEQLILKDTRGLSQVSLQIQGKNKAPASEALSAVSAPALMSEVGAAIRVFLQEEERVGRDRRSVLARTWQRLSWVLVAGTAGAILLATILNLSFSGSIAGRLQQVHANATSLARGGQLAVPLAGYDEIAELDRVFHEMADSLEEITRREKAVIVGTSDGIIIKDLHQRYLMANQAAADFLGKTLQEIIGVSVHDLFDPETARRILERDNDILARGTADTYELVVATKAGAARTYLTTGVPYRDRHGDVRGIIGISRDITEAKRAAEEMAKKNVELEEVNEQKNHFLGVAAHDLRNPLGVIMAYSQFLSDDTGKALDDEQREFVVAIKDTSEFMLKMVTDLLDVTAIEAGQLKLERKATDLFQLVRRNLTLNSVLASRKEISVELLPAPALPAVSLDPGKIEQVLNNLITNAVKFSHHGTAVSVRLFRENDFVVVAVQDHGQGIPATDFTKLFKPFGTTSVQSTAGEQSTGLGLAIVRRVIEGHGGRVWVESEVGSGSTFFFALPADVAVSLAR